MGSPAIMAVQTFSITVSLLASGSIATMTLFDIPELQSQPASRSLPSIRWLFSRGSHIMPQASLLSCSGFAYLAYKAIPTSNRTVLQLLRLASNSTKVNGYLAAALLAMSIGPFTALVMVPTNFSLIKMNEDLGGSRSAEGARTNTRKPGERNAEDSVNSVGEASQFTDLSGPQGKTKRDSTQEEDEKARALMSKFGTMNAVRAVLIGAGGVVGLWTALL